MSQYKIAAATAAVASGNKRKRDDDSDDGREGDNGNNNGSAEPDVVVSLEDNSDEEDDITIDVPDGEFPSIGQLARILGLIEAVPVGKVDDKSLSLLKSLSKWASHKSNKDKSDLWARCKMDLLQLGGLMRMICLIERHMSNIGLVRIASNIVGRLMYYAKNTFADTKSQMKTSATFVAQTGKLRILLLASEEYIPSGKQENWITASRIWVAMLTLYHSADLKQIESTILQPVIEANVTQLCLSESDNSIAAKVNMAWFFASMVKLSLLAHQDLGSVIRENQIMDSFQVFCEARMDVVLDLPDRTKEFLSLCTVAQKSGLLSSDDTKKWLPFVTKALSTHITNNEIEKKAYSFVEQAVDTINHRELESTPLMDTLFSIIKSADASEGLKTKYRAMLKKIL